MTSRTSGYFAASLLVILTLPGPLAAQGSWQVGAPSLRIPAISSSGATNFQVISAATQLSNGSIVVADGAASNLVFFSGDGGSRRTVGRIGTGPGEFQQLWWVGRCAGDSLAVHDLAGRVSIFAPDGKFVRQLSITDPIALTRCGNSGRLAMLSNEEPNPPDEGSWRPTARLVTTNGSTPLKTLRTSVPGPEFALLRQMPVPDPLGRQTVFAVMGDEVLLATGDSLLIERIGPEGRSFGAIRWKAPRVRVTDRNFEVAREAVVLTLPGPMQERLRADIDRVPKHQWMPPYFGLWAPTLTEIWLQSTPSGANPTRFTVLSPRGDVIATLSIPLGLSPLDVTATTVVASQEAADGDVELVVFPIRR